MNSGYLIYHPRRARDTFGGTTVHHDGNTRGNQDPYVWNLRFLHTYCHMAQMSPEVDDICFWVTGDRWPSFSQLHCDLVFVVQQKEYWTQSNHILRSDPVVDSDEAWQDHYKWHHQHPYKRRRRFTLKADPERSFQPQRRDGSLVDITPLLAPLGYPLHMLHQRLAGNRGSRPLKIAGIAIALYDALARQADVRLLGGDLAPIRRITPGLASRAVGRSCC